MTPTELTRVMIQLQADEGYRRHPYRDTTGHLTIGYGRSLYDVGLSQAEAFVLLARDVEDAAGAVTRRWPWTHELAPARLAVLVMMCFNLGAEGLAGFRRMWTALGVGDFRAAASEMRASTWAEQVGARAQRFAEQMETGRWPDERPPAPGDDGPSAVA